MKIFYKQDELNEIINNTHYDIPENIKQIKLDVGLAGEAPNSAIWISETPDRYVFGFEPLTHHWSMLTDFDSAQTTREYPYNFKIIQLGDKTVKFKREVVASLENKFTGIQCVIDDVNEITDVDFYEMDRHLGGSGSSSLLAPSKFHVRGVNDVVKSKAISLEMFLNGIPWDRFEYIEHIKTDCEGKDFDVVRSIGKYLDKVVFISSEMSAMQRKHVINPCDPNKFIAFMKDNDFSILNQTSGDIHFVNNKFKDIIGRDGLNNKILGL
jgi:hypothetical protein